MLRVLYITLGFISLALGIVGMFLPLLPTTPFVLLSAALFMRSSEKFYNKLIENKLFGNIIRNYREDKSIPLHAKVISVTLLWISILFSVFYVLKGKLILQIILLVIAGSVSIHILRYKTKKKN